MPRVSSTCRIGGCLKVLMCPVSALRVGEEVALKSYGALYILYITVSPNRQFYIAG